MPHLHLQVQGDAALGSPTQAFHLINVIERTDGNQRDFRLCVAPREGAAVTAAPADDKVAGALRIPLVSTLGEDGKAAGEQQHFTATLTLLDMWKRSTI